jgi:hypothetical protein
MTFTATASARGPHVDGDGGLAPYDPILPPAGGTTVHRVELPVLEKQAAGRTVWTFGGTVPGPTLRGRVGDVFEVTLVNTGSMGRSIDFHASALAPDGPMRTIEPGERLVYRFRAERAGIWMYHCSTAPMTQHIAAGMFGAVVIDPPDLAPVDREDLLVASALYGGAPGSDVRAEALRTGSPDGWAFNGIAGQYDERPLAARVGQRVRFGPPLRPHHPRWLPAAAGGHRRRPGRQPRRDVRLTGRARVRPDAGGQAGAVHRGHARFRRARHRRRPAPYPAVPGARIVRADLLGRRRAARDRHGRMTTVPAGRDLRPCRSPRLPATIFGSGFG